MRRAGLCTLRRVSRYEAQLTPAPVQLVYALHASLKSIVSGPISLEDRFAQHKAASKHVKDKLTDLGFGFVPTSRDHAANGMTAAKYPKGVAAADILPKLAE
jgi:alanine-glyoxylate transaminase/serine-glyoxylate transaminase/serine-pyruvate transaminase